MTKDEQKITNFFSNLSAATINLVDEFYAPDAEFSDPVVNLRGRDAIRAYYGGLYAAVKSIHFNFSKLLTDQDTVAAFWTMTLEAPKLNRGRPVVLPGVSHIRFDPASGKAAYHRDYFDMGAFVYEHVPLLGTIIRYVKGCLH